MAGYARRRLSDSRDSAAIDNVGGSLSVRAADYPFDNVLEYMRSCYYGKNCDDTKEECANKSYLVEYLSDIVCSRSALSDSGNCSALLLYVVGYFNRIEGLANETGSPFSLSFIAEW